MADCRSTNAIPILLGILLPMIGSGIAAVAADANREFCEHMQALTPLNDKASVADLHKATEALRAALKVVPKDAPKDTDTFLIGMSNIVELQKIKRELAQPGLSKARRDQLLKNQETGFVLHGLFYEKIGKQTGFNERIKFIKRRCPKLDYANAERVPGTTLDAVRDPAASKAPAATRLPARELETGASAKFRSNHQVAGCRGDFSTKVVKANLSGQVPRGSGLPSVPDTQFLSVSLNVTNQSQPGKQLCNLYSNTLAKTSFKVRTGGRSFPNKFPVFRWPSIDLGATDELQLWFQVPANTSELVLVAHHDEDVLATFKPGVTAP
jgi:hypothetical protein